MKKLSISLMLLFLCLNLSKAQISFQFKANDLHMFASLDLKELFLNFLTDTFTITETPSVAGEKIKSIQIDSYIKWSAYTGNKKYSQTGVIPAQGELLFVYDEYQKVYLPLSLSLDIDYKAIPYDTNLREEVEKRLGANHVWSDSYGEARPMREWIPLCLWDAEIREMLHTVGNL